VEAEQAVVDAESQVTLAQQAVVDAESQVTLAQQAVVDAEGKVVIATNQANASIQSAAESLVSKNQSESASITSTDQAILSASARNKSEADKIAAKESEEEATRQAVISTEQASDSSTSKTQSEAARDEILNKAEVNITTAGNILRADGTLFKSISDVEFLRNKAAFAKSFLGGMLNLDFLRVFDSFDRPDSANLGVTDSGATIVKLKGTSGNIINKTCRITTAGDINAVPVNITNTERCRVRVFSNILVGESASVNPFFNTRFFILKDAYNGFSFFANSISFGIVKTKNGESTFLTASTYIAFPDNKSAVGNAVTFEADLLVGKADGLPIEATLIIKQDVTPSILTQIDVSSMFDPELENVFLNPTDIKFIGWGGSNNIAVFIDE